MNPHEVPALVELWHRAVVAFADRPALGTGEGRSVTFADVDAAADRVAHDLRGHGLRAGDPILANLARGPAWLPALLGVWKAGGVVVPVSRQDPHAVDLLVVQTGARLQVGDGAGGSNWPPEYVLAQHDPPSTAPTGVFSAAHAYAMLTSGSTGRPKLALVTHRTSASVLSGLTTTVGIAAGEHALHTAAFSFSSSIRQLFVPLLSGAQVTVLQQTDPYAPDRLLSVASAAGITSLDLTPSHLAGLVQVLETDPGVPRPGTLRRLLVASEILTPRLVARWRRAMRVPHILVHLYGQTETGGSVSALVHADTIAPESPRLPLATPFAPFAAHFEDHPDGAAELLLAGLDPADGVLCDGALERERYDVQLPAASGLYRTGDLFARAPDGRLFFHGRADEQTKIHGVRVDVAGLEQELSALPGVASIVVAAVPREAGGALLGIGYTASQPADRLSPDEISQRAVRWLDPAVGVPHVVRLDECPLNRSGKIDRLAVVEALAAALTAVTEAADPVEALWQRHTSNLSAADAPGAPALDFFAAGGDSLSMIGLLADVARTFQVRVLPVQFHREPTLAGLRNLLAAAAPPPHPAGNATPGQSSPAHGQATARPGTPRAATAFQRGLWINERLLGGASPYWLPVDLDVPVDLDQQRLAQAFRTVLARFDALRLAFAETADDGLALLPDAHSASGAQLQTPPGHWPRLGPLTQQDRLVRLAAASAGGQTRLSLRVHHAVADRPSLVSILQNLCRAYTSPNLSDDLQPAPSFIAWRDELATTTSGSASDAAGRFWAQWLPSPTVAAGRRLGQPHVERHRLAVPGHVVAQGAAGASRHAAWLWAFHHALSTNRLEQAGLIGVDIDLRPPGLTELVGPCINTIPVVLPADVADADGERAAGAAIAQLLPHARVPVAAVVPPPRRPTGDPRQPFFRYHLVYQRSGYPRLQFDGREARYAQLPQGITEHTITLFVRESPERIDLEVAWDTELLNRATALAVLDATATRFGAAKDGHP